MGEFSCLPTVYTELNIMLVKVVFHGASTSFSYIFSCITKNVTKSENAKILLNLREIKLNRHLDSFCNRIQYEQDHKGKSTLDTQNT